MKIRGSPLLFVFAAAFLWSTGGLFIKWNTLTGLELSFCRSLFAMITVAILTRREGFGLNSISAIASVLYAVLLVLFVLSTKATTAANAIFLQYTAPVYVALIGRWYLGERASRIDWLVIAVALAGIALFFLDRLTIAGLWGNILALGSGLAFALVALFLRKEKAGSPIASIVLGNVIVAVAGAPFMFQAPSLGEDGLWRLLLLGTVQLGLPYVFYATAIKQVSALEATLIPLLEPVLNPLWVMLALGERPGPWAIVGGLLVLSAVLGRGVMMMRTRPPMIPPPD